MGIIPSPKFSITKNYCGTKMPVIFYDGFTYQNVHEIWHLAHKHPNQIILSKAWANLRNFLKQNEKYNKSDLEMMEKIYDTHFKPQRQKVE